MVRFPCPSLRSISFAILLSILAAEAWAAPGDHIIEILGRTGDAATGPNLNPIQEIRYARAGGGVHPVSIDDFGFVTFSAEVGTGENAADGIYQYLFDGSVVVLAQSGVAAPGVTFNGEPRNMLSVPWRGYTSSPSGVTHVFSTYISSGTDTYMYFVDGTQISPEPLTYPDYINASYSPRGRFVVSDGRGTEKELELGSSDSMVLADNGTLVWKVGVGIFQAKSQSTIKAVAFLDSPAPGFPESENAIFVTRMDLRGVDAMGRVYFTARVTGSTFSNRETIYRTEADSDELVLLFSGAKEALPGYESSNQPIFEPDDVYPLADGTVILRAGTTGSYGGFWRIYPDGTIELAGILSETTPVSTGGAEVGFRSLRVDFADFAVSEDGAIFFTADVRNGVEGTNQEGIWMIDPADDSVKTIARAPLDGSFGDAPGTDETYFSFSHLTAEGDGHLVFMSELISGKQGLFRTQGDGEVLKIAIEGEPFDGSVIETIRFTPDHAGAELSENQGAAGLSKHGQVVFTAELANDTTAIVKSLIEVEVQPIGTTYKWDGGAGTDSWHTVGNWVDEFGTRWDRVPGTVGNEKVEIANGFAVTLSENVSIRQLTLGASTLEIGADLEFSHFIEAGGDSLIDLQSGTMTSESGDLSSQGRIRKSTAGSSLVEIDDFEVAGGEVRVEGGDLTFRNSVSVFEASPTIAENAVFVIEDNSSAFRGDSVTLTVQSGLLDVRSFGLSFEGDTTINAIDSAAMIKVGKGDANPDANIELRSVIDSSARSIEIVGNGSVEIRQSIALADGDAFVNNHSGASDSGLTLDIRGAEYLLVPEGATFENNGHMKIGKGGISAGESPTNSITNNGTIDILDIEGDASRAFDCINKGTINQYGDAHFIGPFIQTTRAVHNMYGATLANGNLESELDEVRLTYESRATLKVFEGSNRIIARNRAEGLDAENVDYVFQGSRFYSVLPSIAVHGSASLSLTNGSIGPAIPIHVVDEASLFEMDGDGAVCGGFTIYGKGRSRFATTIHVINHGLLPATFPDIPVSLENATVEFDGAVWQVVDQSELLLIGQVAPDSQRRAPRVPLDQSLTIRGATIENTFATTILDNVSVTVEEDLVLANSIFNFGNVLLKASIILKPGAVVAGSFSNGGDSRGDGTGTLRVSDNLAEPVTINVQYTTTERAATIVGANSRLILEDFFALNFDPTTGELIQGHWETREGGRITFGKVEGENPDVTLPIRKVGEKASLHLRSPPDGGESINGFPNPPTDLENKGSLTLENHDLVFETSKNFFNDGDLSLLNSDIIMDGGSFRNRGRFLPLLGSKVVGDVQSVRDDVGGTVQLAGNLNIEGNLTTDGVIALGASPGSGLVTGNLTLLPGSEVRVEFAGEDPGTGFDFLEVGGTAELDGTLDLSLIDEYLPDSGDAFLFLKAGAISGGFAEIDQSEMGRQRRFDVASDAEGLTATASAISISSYSEWRAVFFDTEDAADDLISGPVADPDGDGLSNLFEYVTGGIPDRATEVPFRFDIDGSSLSGAGLVWAKGVADYDWSLEYSIDLSVWEPLEFTIEESEEFNDFFVYGLDVDELPEAPERFYRFNLEPNP